MTYTYSNPKQNRKQNQPSATPADDNQILSSLDKSPWLARHEKTAFLGLSATSVVLAASVVFLGVTQYMTAKENKALSAQVKALENYNSSETASKINEVRKTESTVHALQNYLQERGLNPDGTLPNASTPEDNKNNQTPAMGGAYRPISAQTPYGRQFNQRASAILDSIKNVPLGLPHTGVITSTFGNRKNPFGGHSGEHHSGIDFRGAIGEPIHSTADGVVIHAGASNGYGYAVKIAHGYQLETLYGHLSAVNVSVGQHIKAGDVIGKLGNTGRSTGPHLHYEVRKEGTPIDPEHFLHVQ